MNNASTDKVLYIDFPTYDWYKPAVMVEGKELKAQRDDRDCVFFSDSFSSDSVKVEIFTRHRLAGAFWWLIEIFFYIISIFGIFDERGVYKYRPLRVEFTVPLSGDITKLVVRSNKFIAGDKALFIETPSSIAGVEPVGAEQIGVVVEKNEFYKDKTFEGRRKGVKIIKVLIFFAVIAGIILTLINL
jgi:hypothetical protein